MNRNVSMVTVISVLIYVIGLVCGSGPLCMECQSEAVPSSCNTVVQCGPHEKCLLRKYENERGMVLYHSGCMDTRQCAFFDTNKTVVQRSTKREITLCMECCDGNYCNSGGCNAPGFSTIQGHPPVCYICPNISNPTSCSHIDRCKAGETCFIHKASQGHFSMGCKATQSCHNTHSDNVCTTCCHSDFCNRQCHTTSSGHNHHNHVTTTSSGHNHNNHVTTTSSGHNHHNHVTTKEPAHTTPTIGTTIQPLLRCFVCPESFDPNCHFHHMCPQDHVCYSSVQKHLNNDDTYNFQCRHKTECPLDSHLTDWMVVGRRAQGQDARKGYCCFSDDCNYLPPTVTHLHTTPITSSIPRITDVGPLLKNTTYGVNVGIHCAATGSPPPTIHWNVPVPLPSPSNYVRPEMGTLIIWGVTHENAGFYTCIATNANGVDTQTVKLNVS